MRTPIHPLWGILEIAGLTVLYFAVLWVLGPAIATAGTAGVVFWPLILAAAVHLLYVSPVVLHRDPWEWRGLGGRAPDGSRPGAFRSAWKAYAAFTAAAAVLLIAYAAWSDPARLTGINWRAVQARFVEYLGSGLAQALIFQGFVASRVRTIVGARVGRAEVHRISVALATGVLFALFHWPNPQLMAVTLPAGLCWTWIYYRRPNLLLLVLSHAVLGTILSRVVLLYMRIGPFYARPDLFLWRTVIPGLREMIGNLY